MKPFCYIILLFITISIGDCYRILAIFPTPAPSHYTLASKILKELVHRGHELVVVSPFPQRAPIKNFTDISVEDISLHFKAVKRDLFALSGKSYFGKVHFVTGMGVRICEWTFQHENVQKLLNSNEKFDLILMSQFVNEAHMGFAYKFGAPVVMLATMPPFVWGSFVLSLPSTPAYVPNLMSGFTGDMSFWQRFVNSIYDLYGIIYHQLVILPKHRELVRKYVPGAPDLYDFVSNVSLLLINSHVSIYDAIPKPPNAIDIGGFHVDKPKPLPNDLQTFLDTSTNGVVLFSMGSNLKTSDLPVEKTEAILRVFRKLKQNIIWKWEDDNLTNLPKNVKIMKWLPQQDILAHRNVQAFITHGGLLSTIESVYFGVPIVGMPVFADQKTNVRLAVSHGYAEVVYLEDLNEKTFGEALEKILNNPKYKENVQRRSRIIHDRPMRPIDSAVYWIEYVVRHHGAPHLKYPGVKLTWYQRNLLDIVAFMIILTIVPIIIIKRLIKRSPVVDKTKKNS